MTTRDRSLDVAVTGVSARFPGPSDLDRWWSAIARGAVLTRRYERDELLEAGVPPSLADDPEYVPVRGHLAGADRFDNAFFRVSPRDAELTDPQHRLMLEVAWSALEDAACGPPDAAPVTGVYASATRSGYLRGLLAQPSLDPSVLDQAIHGTEPDFMASRISYKIGLGGPAVAVQTACSSSLVAVHLAAQALLNGDCDQALVVAAGIGFPQAGHLHVPGGVLSGSGTCRPFDESADGALIGSGVACVVLRRLADALADGPEPYGVILGSAINNDGPAKAGYYAPSVAGQAAVIEAALRAADVDASSLGYLETHGTGTPVGDPIEWAAASSALAAMGARPRQIAIGALKASIGHLDAAAGVASLIRALLVLRDGVVPPVAGFTRLNPLLEAEGSPLFVPTTPSSWTGPEPRRAGVSSFGIGGTNAHVVIEQAPERAAPPPRPERDRLVVLSAADRDALSRAGERLASHLGSHDDDLADVALTLAAGRVALPERLAVTGRTTAEVAERLSGAVRGTRPPGGPAPVVFLFPGQGAQHPGMAVPLAHALPGFSSALGRVLDAFDGPVAERISRALLDPASPAGELHATELAQPALFAVEHAAAVALVELGIVPASLAGHSLGEITAACLAGVFDLAGAARFVTARGRAMQACPPGVMLALGCDEGTAGELLAESGAALHVAALNSPDATVVGGTADAVDAFASWLGDRVFSRRLFTSHAFHTPLIEPALPQLAAELAKLDLRAPDVPFASNVTGEIVDSGAVVAPALFVDGARRPVRFAASLSALGRRFSGAVMVEVGPGRVLSALAESAGFDVVPMSGPRRALEGAHALAALGTLWTRGHPADIASLARDGERIHLPGYPFAGPRWVAPEAIAPEATERPATLAEPPGLSPAPPAAASPGAAQGNGAPAPQEGPADAAVLLAALWEELLGHTGVTDDSDFFELGGDSLLITRLARKVDQELGIRVPIRAMLAGRTLGRQKAIVLDLMGVSSGAGGAG